jgi:hypothetical protein
VVFPGPVSDADKIESCEAFAQGRLVVIECPIDYSVNYATFSQELAKVVCEV